MHIEFLLEETSAEIVLTEIVPKIVGEEITFRMLNFRGKHNLLKNLPDRLKGYKAILEAQEDWRIVVLIDEDREDCQKLKQKLEEYVQNAGLATPSISDNFRVLNRIAVEEIEAWFFGDINALRNQHHRVSPNLTKQATYRNPDTIKGGTWEALERVLSNAGYYTKGFMSKTEIARNIAPFMNPEQNTSKSFQIFRDGLKSFLD